MPSKPEKKEPLEETILPTHIVFNKNPKAVEYYLADLKCFMEWLSWRLHRRLQHRYEVNHPTNRWREKGVMMEDVSLQPKDKLGGEDERE